MIAIFQAIARWIKTFKDSHLYVFYDNFTVLHGVQKTSNRGEAMQSLHKLVMFCAEYDIKV